MAASPVRGSPKIATSFFPSWTSTFVEPGGTTASAPISPVSPCSQATTSSSISKRPQPVSSQSQPTLEPKTKPPLQSSIRASKASKDSRRSQARSSSSINLTKNPSVRNSSDSKSPLLGTSMLQTPSSQMAKETQLPATATRNSSNSNSSQLRSPSSGSHQEDDPLYPELRISDSATKDGLPPRDARSGFVWNLKPAGYWSEEKSKKRRTRQSGTSTPSSTAIPSPASPAAMPAQQLEAMGGKVNKYDLARDHGRLLSDTSSPTTGFSARRQHDKAADRTEGFFNQTRRRIRALHRGRHLAKKADNSDASSTGSGTKVLLDMANNILNAERERRSPDSTQSASGTSNRSSRKLSIFNKPRRTTSASSSVRNLLMGRPPVNTPKPDALYGGKDANDYFKVEISDPDNPTFLPSEAKRVNTPPLPTDGPRRGHRRGFFFDMSSPGGTWRGPKSKPSTPRTPGSVSGRTSSGKRLTGIESLEDAVWFRVKQEPEDSDQTFELNVPEHLPNSPLCPKNPSHKSGGKGVCVYHGRNRNLSKEA
ncbi:MAG: hypothetical protein M1812_002992 [Candelaria pacifica]|nr:MAG: hypothetical protein M1812_002992 [Candelaria pacifica]